MFVHLQYKETDNFRSKDSTKRILIIEHHSLISTALHSVNTEQRNTNSKNTLKHESLFPEHLPRIQFSSYIKDGDCERIFMVLQQYYELGLLGYYTLVSCNILVLFSCSEDKTRLASTNKCLNVRCVFYHLYGF